MQSTINLDKVTIMSISSMLLAGCAAYYVYDELKKSISGNNTAKYVALASLTAIPAYATFIYDFMMKNLGVSTIDRSIGFVIWAIIFVAAAFLFGRHADHKDSGN